jgi:folylpolyglutamate synthase/dihydropteroate synthase
MRARVAPDVATALHAALAATAEGTVLLTGSLFAVGEAMAAFGGAPGEML